MPALFFVLLSIYKNKTPTERVIERRKIDMENERKECVIEVTSLPTSKAIFRGIYEEAESMAEGTEGRSVMLSATSTTGKPMIYAQIDGKNIGLVQNPSQIEEAFEIISSGNFSSHLCGAGEGGRVLVKVRESDTPVKEIQ